MPATWTMPWTSWPAARLATRHRCLHRAGRRHGVSVMKLRREILELILASPLLWLTFLSADGKTAFSASCTHRDATRASSIRKRKLWSSAGRRDISERCELHGGG